MSQKGMTLVELMVVLVVASVLGIAILNMFTISNRTFMDQNKVIDVQREGRLVIDYIVRTLRETGLDPLNSDGCEGIRLRDDDFGFTLIIDRDFDVDGTCEGNDKEVVGFRIREEPDGSKILMRGFNYSFGNERWHDMAKNISDFRFDYYDETGAILVQGSPFEDIRSIDVILEFKDEKSMGGDFTRSYKTRIDLRNF